jgi:ankyrin repeat protein
MTLPHRLISLIATLLTLCSRSLAFSTVDAMPPTTKFFLHGAQAALEIAVRANDADALGRALAQGADANSRGRFEITPLMVAVDVQSIDAVRILLKAGALPNAVAADRNGPVSLAVQSYRAEPHGRAIMMAIFQAGGDPNSRRPDGDPVIFRFLEDHDAEDVRLMKSLGADLNIRDRGDDPLITSVAMAQDWDMVWALIELGARVDYEDGTSRRPISMALSLPYPAPDSPLYPYKLKVWQFLKDKGIPVKPMKP